SSLSLINYLFYAIITFFFFTDTPTTEIYTLSLHDALPILMRKGAPVPHVHLDFMPAAGRPSWGVSDEEGKFKLNYDRERDGAEVDRKSTRLNSSHDQISYAVFCLKKKKKIYKT